MRYHCGCCGKSVSSELPSDSIIRAFLVCPECIGQNRILFPELPSEEFQQNKPNTHGTFTGWDPINNVWVGESVCPSCSGTGRVEDPQHGHDMRCERCGGTGRVQAR